MPNRRQHVIDGGLSAIGVNALECLLRGRPWSLKEALLVGLGGALGGAGPDAVDTPSHPNHRAFAHSLCVASTLPFAYRAIENVAIPKGIKDLLKGAIVGCGCHLIQDAQTDKGLPVVGLRIW